MSPIVREVGVKLFCCTVPWAMVVLPVAFLFVGFLEAVAMVPGLSVDLAFTVLGSMMFTIGFLFMALKHEKAIEEEL